MPMSLMEQLAGFSQTQPAPFGPSMGSQANQQQFGMPDPSLYGAGAEMANARRMRDQQVQDEQRRIQSQLPAIMQRVLMAILSGKMPQFDRTGNFTGMEPFESGGGIFGKPNLPSVGFKV
mgnify:CR=1 FL=1